MVISTGSAGSSGGIFLSGKENWNNSVPGCKCLERSSPCTGTSKLTLCCFALVLWAEAALSLSVFIHSEHWPWLCSCWVTSLLSAVSSFLIFFSTGVAVCAKCSFQSHHPKKWTNRPKCMWIYLNRRNGPHLEVRPGLLIVTCNCCPPNAELLQLFLTWGANTLVVWHLGDRWTALEVCSSEAAQLLHSALQFWLKKISTSPASYRGIYW